MNEFDFFISMLEKQDMVTIANRFNIQIQGFDKNIQNAPKKWLSNAIREYLTNGLLRKKKRALDYNQLLITIADEMNLQISTLEEFIMHVEFEHKIRPYQAFAYIIVNYPEIYNEKKELIKLNLKNNDFIFKDFIEEKTMVEKIQSIIQIRLKKEETYNLLSSYESLLEKEGLGKEYYLYKEKINGDIESLFRELINCPKEKMHIVLLAFIIENKNYLNSEYCYILEKVKSDLENLKFKMEKQKNSLIIANNEQLMKEKEKLLQDISDFSKLDKENEYLKNQLFSMQKEIKILEIEQEKLDLVNKHSKILHSLVNNILKDRKFLIVTNEIDEFNNTPLENYVIERKVFLEDKKTNNLQEYRGKILFFTRISFQTKEWGKIKSYLEQNKFKYYEIGHFDIASYMAEIIQFICREELEYEFG